MVVAIVGQQGHPQREPVIQRISPRPQEPRGIGRMRAGLHPNPCFYVTIADFVGPYGNGVVEMKAANPDMTGRSDVAALPSVREQRPRTRAFDQRGIRLGKYQPTAKRRCNRRDQQSVIAASQAAGNRATRIPAEPIGDPPFASLCLAEVTADRAGESDRTRSRFRGATLRLGLVHFLGLTRAQRKGAAQRFHLSVGSDIEKTASQPEILEERPKVLVPRVAVEGETPEVMKQNCCRDHVEYE